MDKCEKKVGNVRLDYSKYSGNDSYSDGDIENEILASLVSGESDNLLHETDKWPILYHLSEERWNAIEWIDISKEDTVLEIGSGCGALTGLLAEKSKSVTCIELSERRSLINAERNKAYGNVEIKIGNFCDAEPDLGQYDVVTLIGVLEYAKMYVANEEPYLELLKIAKKHLSKNGKLILAIENKVGLKYWNGAPEDHTGRLYSGLNDYCDSDEIRTFSANELKRLLKNAGFAESQFYFPIPDYKIPRAVYSEEYSPSVGSVRTYRTNYAKMRTYNFYEDIITDQLCNDGMFGYMSNSFIVIAGEKNNCIFAKYNRERKTDYRIATKIYRRADRTMVVKQPLSLEAHKHVELMKENREKLNGIFPIELVDGTVKDDVYVSDYVNGRTIDEILYDKRLDVDKLIEATKYYIMRFFNPEVKELIPFFTTQRFEEVFGKVNVGETFSYRVTNIDLLFSNIVLNEKDEAYAFDFEWVFDFPIPYRYVRWRTLKELYYKYQAYLKGRINISGFMGKMGINEDETSLYTQMEKHFGEYVCGNNRCEEYLSHYVKPSIMQEIKLN